VGTQQGSVKAWFSSVGLALGAFFFAASLTPSLIPRGPLVQGVLGGMAIAIGYAIGVVCLYVWRYLQLPEAGRRARYVWHAVIAVLSFVLVVMALFYAVEWQNSIRAVMDMPRVDSAYPIRVLSIAIVVFAVLFGLGALVLRFARWITTRVQRFLPRRVATLLGGGIALVLVWTLANGVLVRYAFQSLDLSFREFDALIEPDRPQPTDAARTGSAESLFKWNELGRAGREFVSSGPLASDISTLTGREAVTPIRVYAGLQVADTPKARANLVLEELKRQRAFDREVLVIITPTGTGWVDPAAMDGLEFLYDGNVASAALQYSYLNSPLSLLFQSEQGAVSARALFETVYDYWKGLPADSRPKLYLHGLSLGAFNSQRTVSFFDIFDDPIDGAVWSGPPFQSAQWRAMTNARQPDSPEWLPVFHDGKLVRFMNQHGEAPASYTGWGRMRVVYLQYASDAITFFDPTSLYREPDWMKAPRGPDVSPALSWYPVVTFLQLAVDMGLADTTPIGYGHVYAPQHYLRAWLAVTGLDTWSPEQLTRLEHYLRDASPRIADAELRGG